MEKDQAFKWSTQLQERFLDAVSRLGGAAKATPRSVERLMGVSGVTLRQLKNQLQKHRKKEEEGGNRRFLRTRRAPSSPMEAQRRSQERLEVQRHLQLRIEAQGKYLQSVLDRAREMLEMESGEAPPQAETVDCASSDSGSCLTCEDGHGREDEETRS